MDSGALELLATFFHGIWEGLESVNVPGTSWSMAGFMLAIFSAGVIGKIMKALFSVFGSHFDQGRAAGRSSEKRNGWQKGEELD